MNPKLMIADEISSMLDPSNAANMLRLLKGLQNTQGFSMLYITHDIAIAEKISDKVYVMKNGRIIEKGIASEVFSNPKESYTKMLLKGMKGIVFK
ncbi:Oligopeptide transport ATP-binding protein OppD [bioreactor metagenome]|uniref:Oligopeptide transport ATP-binding protein OppD n=1 Tax=bioreactor metagenome TaxID=1076179 RepID=A0A645H791_9ZZZZ